MSKNVNSWDLCNWDKLYADTKRKIQEAKDSKKKTEKITGIVDISVYTELSK